MYGKEEMTYFSEPLRVLIKGPNLVIIWPKYLYSSQNDPAYLN